MGEAAGARGASGGGPSGCALLDTFSGVGFSPLSFFLYRVVLAPWELVVWVLAAASELNASAVCRARSLAP